VVFPVPPTMSITYPGEWQVQLRANERVSFLRHDYYILRRDLAPLGKHSMVSHPKR
jgi:hypothetical protein